MKKRIVWLSLILVVLALVWTGCNTTDEPIETEPDTTAEDEETSAVEEITTESETETEVDTSELIEEAKRREDQAWLDEHVTYLDYILAEKDTPYYVGRWFEKEIDGVSHMVTTTDGSHLYFLIEGATKIDVNFTKISVLETPYFAYSIDGATPVRQHITNPTVNLPDTGRHTVRIVADGLTENEKKWKDEIGFALKNIVPDAGRLTGIKPDEKIVFFYGDSITEGVRAVGPNTNADGNSATNAYTWYTAKELGVVPYYIGYGASGICMPGSFQKMQTAIDYLSVNRKVDDSEYANVTPDLIVINHGANDSNMGVSTATFKNVLKSTIKRLQEKYPGVKIVYMVAFLEASTLNVINQGKAIEELAADMEGLYVVHTKDWRLSYTDGNLHPNVAGAKKAGQKLADELKKIMGEDFFN